MEMLNDVLGYDLKIYQNYDYFCFSIDSIVLANFVNVRCRTKKILDLGCGNGIVSLILSLRTKSHIDGVEIQKDLVDMALRSVIYNCKEKFITLYNMDMKDFLIEKRYNTYDLILSNPPYFKNEEESTKNMDIHKAIARHEVFITLEEVIKIAFQLLKEGGVFALVQRVSRFMEVLELLRKYKIEPKYIRFVYDHITTSPSLFYIEGIKCGRSGLIIDKPFVMYDENRQETEEYRMLLEEVM